MKKHLISVPERISSLKNIIDQKNSARIMEAHSGISAMIVESAKTTNNRIDFEFDGIWESSLTDSATKGMPDASIIGTESRLHTINEIAHVTSKPLIVDGDTGGSIPQFEFLISNLERLGVSSVIIEDKIFPKRNSLDSSASQELENPEIFANKIKSGIDKKSNPDFLIVARIESLIAGTGLKDAINRAEHYIDAGIDGIMIHSNEKKPKDLIDFAKKYNSICNKFGKRPILVSVPTTYNNYTEKSLIDLGFNIIIHANHLLRASHQAMKETAQIILNDGKSERVDKHITPVKEIFQFVGHDKITEQDRENSVKLRTPIIIPSAGKDPIFTKTPKSLIRINNKPIIEHQIELIKSAGFKNIVLVNGYKSEDFSILSKNANLKMQIHTDYKNTHILHSLMAAKPQMDNGFILLFSDILFDSKILKKLINIKSDIVLGIDNSFTYNNQKIDKKLDLVVRKKSFQEGFRSLNNETLPEITKIGKNIDPKISDYEFIGIAYFSNKGAEILKNIFLELNNNLNSKNNFQEAKSFEMASITDMIQEIIDRGYLVNGIEIRQGWREIHSPNDIQTVEKEIKSLDQA
ncbi:MAG: phosphoenolpyruvate mutase [Chloroflexi bacterium]|nr:phosphoenolpyruvate mutase [Chloroflexota bacterium]|tara:strand:- start:1321 stop:3057 length:1737 start_codon:yes stop_codon:yes gene_type:complete